MKKIAIFPALLIVLVISVSTYAATNREAEQHFEKANELLKRMDYEGAIDEYSKVIDLSSGSKIAQDAQYWIGQSHLKAGRFDDAKATFAKLIEQYPTSAIIPVTKLMVQHVEQANKDRSLFEAVRKCDIEQVKSLLSKGSDVSVKDAKGRTPLHYAVHAGNKEVAELLIKAGADLNCKDKDGQTPTRLAWANNYINMVVFLVSKGADVSLHLAAYLGDLAKVKNFIESGIDVNAKGEFGVTPLYMSLIDRLHIDVAEFLLDKGANPNTTAKNDATLLHQWAWGGDTDIAKSLIEFLISKGANVNALQGDSRWTPLHTAANRGNVEVAKVLIANGANLDARSRWDSTPLYEAVWNQHWDMARLLVNKGADVNFTSKGRWPPFYYILSGNDKDLVELMVDKGNFAPAFHIAAFRGNLAKVKSICANGNDVDRRDQLNWTPLHWAASGGQRDVAEFLISKGADLEAITKYKLTPLHQAATKELAELLLSKGVDVDARDERGRTPLHRAAGLGREQVVELLIASGAEVDAKDKRGRTALHTASIEGKKRTVELLIFKGASVNKKDNRGRTALMQAIRQGHTEVVELLRYYGAKE